MSACTISETADLTTPSRRVNSLCVMGTGQSTIVFNMSNRAGVSPNGSSNHLPSRCPPRCARFIEKKTASMRRGSAHPMPPSTGQKSGRTYGSRRIDRFLSGGGGQKMAGRGPGRLGGFEEALGGGHAPAFADDRFDGFPVGFRVEADAHPAAWADVGRDEVTFRVGLDHVGLVAGWSLAPDRDAAVAVV